MKKTWQGIKQIITSIIKQAHKLVNCFIKGCKLTQMKVYMANTFNELFTEFVPQLDKEIPV